MDGAVRTRWADALRSGEYTPGIGALYDELSDSYCALGVLCAVAEQDGVIKKSRGAFEQYLTYDGYQYRLPPAVTRWAGLGDSSPKIRVNGRTVQISLLNDCSDYEFKHLADIIEEQL